MTIERKSTQQGEGGRALVRDVGGVQLEKSDHRGLGDAIDPRDVAVQVRPLLLQVDVPEPVLDAVRRWVGSIRTVTRVARWW